MMKTGLTLLVIGTAVTALFGQTVQVQRSTVSDEVLERRVPGNDLEDVSTPEAVALALGSTSTPGGLVRTAGCAEDTFKYRWKPGGDSLRDSLDKIVSEDSRYRWHIEDGVVNVLPKGAEPSLLRLRIVRFDMANVESADAALGHLLALPELKKKMEDLRLEPGLRLFVQPKSPRPRLFDIHCENVSFREALNCIARAQGLGVWDYVEIRCNGRTQVVIRF